MLRAEQTVKAAFPLLTKATPAPDAHATSTLCKVWKFVAENHRRDAR
jgi:hypothetical protein